MCTCKSSLSHRQSEASPYDSRLFCRGKHASTGLHCKVWHCLPVGRLVRYLNGNIPTFRRYSNYRVCVAQRLVISKFGTAIPDDKANHGRNSLHEPTTKKESKSKKVSSSSYHNSILERRAEKITETRPIGTHHFVLKP